MKTKNQLNKEEQLLYKNVIDAKKMIFNAIAKSPSVDPQLYLALVGLSFELILMELNEEATDIILQIPKRFYPLFINQMDNDQMHSFVYLKVIFFMSSTFDLEDDFFFSQVLQHVRSNKDAYLTLDLSNELLQELVDFK